MCFQVVMRILQDCIFQPHRNSGTWDQIHLKNPPKGQDSNQKILMFVNIDEHIRYIVFSNSFWEFLLQSKVSWVAAELNQILSFYYIKALPFLTLISPKTFIVKQDK